MAQTPTPPAPQYADPKDPENWRAWQAWFNLFIKNVGQFQITLDSVTNGEFLVWNSTTGTWENKTKEEAGLNAFIDNEFTIQDDGDNTKEIAFQASGITTSTVRTITMPDQDIDLTPDSGSFIKNVVADTTPQLGGNLDVQASQINTSTTNGDIVLAPDGTGAISVPAGTYETNVTDDDDIPNKKYVDDQVTGAGHLSNIVEDTTPQLGADLDANSFDIQFDDATGIRDDSDNEQLIFQKTASAVNHIEITNAAAGGDPKINAAGDDTNVDLDLEGKGTGRVKVINSQMTVDVDNIGTAGSGSANDLVVRCASGDAAGGINIITDDGTTGSLFFGRASSVAAGRFQYLHTSDHFLCGPSITGGLSTFRYGQSKNGFRIESNGTCVAMTANYEALVTADDDIPNKKFCDDTYCLLEGSDGVVMGSGTVNASAILELDTTTKAFLPPRMTAAQRNSISSPVAGMVIYNTDDNVLNFHNGTSWGAV